MMVDGSERSMRIRVDWRLIFYWLLLVLIGWVSIYASVESGIGEASIFDFSTKSGKQMTWILASALVGYFIIFIIKPQIWEVVSLPSYGLMMILLIAVIFLGVRVNGSKSWFSFGAFRFQPAEVSKITTSLLVAHILRGTTLKTVRKKDLRALLPVIALPMIAILAQGETGIILVYFGYLFVFYREGLSGWWIVALGIIIVLFILSVKYPLWVPLTFLAVIVGGYFLFMFKHARNLRAKIDLRRICLYALALGCIIIFTTNFVFDNVLRPHQKERIEVLLGMTDDLTGAGYNVHQSMIAIGSGGFFGKGFLKGTQTSFGFVPEQSTDFIFCTIGEEFGFVGCTAVILILLFMILRIISTAESVREPFTRIYGYCIASFIFVHMIINIGMTIGLMPVIGIPLPFISYGGSSMLSFTVMLAIYLALLSQEKKYF